VRSPRRTPAGTQPPCAPRLSGADAIDATRTLRAALHGFVTLEALGGLGLPLDVDRSFARLVEILDAALRTWWPGRR